MAKAATPIKKPAQKTTRDRSKTEPAGPWRDKRYIAARYDISLNSVDRYIQDGTLPAPSKFGRLVRWHDSQLAEFDAQLLSNQEG